jgi:potassium voltage-gated channel Shal-related subfamily D protein 2
MPLPNNGSPAIPKMTMTGQDLSNLKLAENQTELSRQIAELRATIEEQSVMVDRLIGLLDKGKQRERS